MFFWRIYFEGKSERLFKEHCHMNGRLTLAVFQDIIVLLKIVFFRVIINKLLLKLVINSKIIYILKPGKSWLKDEYFTVNCRISSHSGQVLEVVFHSLVKYSFLCLLIHTAKLDK